MAELNAAQFLPLLPVVVHSPNQSLWTTYDAEADVLYINFKKPSVATESEITDDDTVIRKEGDEIIGITILHASKRNRNG